MTIESNHTNAEICSIPGTTRESSSEIFPQQREYVTERIRITIWDLMRRRSRNNLAFISLTPALQNTTYVTIRSLTVTKITDIKLTVYVSMFHRKYTHTFVKSQERVREPIRINSRASAVSFADTGWRLYPLLLSTARFKNTVSNTEIRCYTRDLNQTRIQIHTGLLLIFTIKQNSPSAIAATMAFEDNKNSSLQVQRKLC